MTDIRRYPMQNKPVFITAVCHGRGEVLKTEPAKRLLLDVMEEVRGEKPFKLLAYVILNDHAHWLMHVENESEHAMSDIVHSIKLRFTHRFKKMGGMNGNAALWQRRFWDHIIRDERDLFRHLDYIHFNPVKHGYVRRPSDYPWSSIWECIENGKYAADWAAMDAPPSISGMNPE